MLSNLLQEFIIMLDLLEDLEIFFWSSLIGVFIAILCTHSPFKQKG